MKKPMHSADSGDSHVINFLPSKPSSWPSLQDFVDYRHGHYPGISPFLQLRELKSRLSPFPSPTLEQQHQRRNLSVVSGEGAFPSFHCDISTI